MLDDQGALGDEEPAVGAVGLFSPAAEVGIRKSDEVAHAGVGGIVDGGDGEHSAKILSSAF